MNLFELQSQEFTGRHIGPDEKETSEMLSMVGVSSLDELINETVPLSIRMKGDLSLPEGMSEESPGRTRERI